MPRESLFPESRPEREHLQKELAFWGIFPEGTLEQPDIQYFVAKNGILTGYRPSGDILTDALDPWELAPSSPLADLFQAPGVVNLFGIGHLGPRRDVPDINLHSRGEHVWQVGMEALKIAIHQGFSRKDQALAFLVGVLHDPHPPLGDTGKMIYDIKEADLVSSYFDQSHTTFWHDWIQKFRAHIT